MKEARRLDADEVQDLLEDNPQALLVDVRAPHEYHTIRIARSINVPLEDIEAGKIPTSLSDPSRTYLLCCRTGRRSQKAANWLLAHGYEHIFNAGGVLDWPFGLISDANDAKKLS